LRSRRCGADGLSTTRRPGVLKGYEEMPGEAAQRVIAENQQEQETAVGAH
jgi:hypothetical protein